MLRTISTDLPVIDRNISVITNFGCQTNCWYCIWKTHRLKDTQLETDWKKLYQFLKDNQSKGKVSVSGGGDCLYNYEKYESWWNKFFDICGQLNLYIDVHSREKFYNEAFWHKVNRCVLSSDILSDDIDYFKWLSQHTKMRIVHVVTQYSTDKLIEEYIEFCKSINCQFTIKELVGFDDMGKYKKYIKKYDGLFYLDSGDYNLYYMPDNTITDKFL